MKESESIVTSDDILKACEEVMKRLPKQQENLFAFKTLQQPGFYAGMPIYEVHDQAYPKIQLSKSFSDKWLTDEARDKINNKLVAMLGTRIVSPIPKGSMYMFNNNIIARPEQCAILKDILA